MVSNMDRREMKLQDRKLLDDAAKHHGVPHSSIVLGLVTMAQFMVILDFSIIQIALPTIGKELGVSIDALQWLVTAYGITFAGFLMLSGRSGDVYGHRRLFIIGLLIFSIASLFGGIAPSETVLVGARAIQGLGAAIASATGLSILVAAFPEGRARNRALSIFAAVMGSAFASGMIAGGLITAFLGWRWIFDINVPIGFAVVLLSLKFISKSKRLKSESANLDFGGAILVTGGLMTLVYALTSVQNVGIKSLHTLAFLGLSAFVLGAFLVAEKRTKVPLMPLRFVRREAVFGANALAMLTLAAYVGMIFIITIYLQRVLGFSPLSAGLAFAPMGLVFVIASGFLSSKFVNRFGVRAVLVAGMILSTAGYVFFTQISVHENYLSGLLPSMTLISLGNGLAFTATNIAALAGTRRGEEGLASGLINTSRQIGGPIGLAVLITIASIWTSQDLSSGLSQSTALVAGFDHAFFAAAGLAGIGALFALFIKPESRGSIEAVKEIDKSG